MSTKPIDYDSLAKQHGASGVDYDSLAQQHGGNTDNTQSPAGFQPVQPITGKSLLKSAFHDVSDFVRGTEKGWDNTVFNTIGLVNSGLRKLPSTKIPFTNIGLTGDDLPPLGPKPQELEPSNSAQKLGYGAEQIGEFFIPGGAEEKAGLKAAELLPKAAKVVKPLARVATTAGITGVQNKMQGGDFSTGAEAGVAGGAIGEGARAAAPTIARMALGIPKRIMARGATPGEAILTETRGIRPSSIADQATEKLGQLEDQYQTLEQQHAGNLVSLKPARVAVANSIEEATERNSTDALRKLNRIKSQLTTQVDESGKALKVPQTETASVPSGIVDEFGNPILKSAEVPSKPIEQAIPELVPPGKARALKQGVGEEVKNWMIENPKLAESTKAQVYGALNEPLHAAVPGSAEIDQKMSSLIPVADYAERRALSAGPGERIAGRVAAHTGALAGGVGGAITGYQHGGTEGALIGGAAGLALPEMVSSPTMRMAVARVANAPGPAVRLVTGSGLQLDRSSAKPADTTTPPETSQRPSLYTVPGKWTGLLTQGNIDIAHRPDVLNPDGTHSSVRSVSFNVDGKEVLMPTVSEDGRIMSNQEALQQYRRTGKHLGMFDTAENATAYAQALHEQQAAQGR